MREKIRETDRGPIHYWVNDFRPGRRTLALLPGLTADHRLFDRQTAELAEDGNILTWDAPGHGASRPFRLDFTLGDKADWLHAILQAEAAERPVLIGQSMGGYVAQRFMQRFPGEAAGFVSIDSAPLERSYMTAAEIWLLYRTEPMYRAFPWRMLERLGVRGCAETEYGRSVMRDIFASYAKDEYCRLAGHGYLLLAQALDQGPDGVIDCPAILICGENDRAGSTKSYNRRWTRQTDLPLYWIKGAGHNSNTDRPDEVNRIIRDFVQNL